MKLTRTINETDQSSFVTWEKTGKIHLGAVLL